VFSLSMHYIGETDDYRRAGLCAGPARYRAPVSAAGL